MQPPALSLPKGGGAIRGLGEKFAANPVTGTGNVSVPVFCSPGRSGFGPQLEISYDSGAGNGPFGFGWSLSLPSITRRTDKGLPKYRDAEESDVFILSGAEDLVPVLVEQDGAWQAETLPPRLVKGAKYSVRRYRPRIEGLFARIENWTDQQTGETHWRSISRDNVTTIYGRTSNSRIEDPEPADGIRRIFSWLVCESYDDRGNAIFYEYQPEDSAGIQVSQVHERNRTDDSRSANRYLKRIRYGNKTPIEPDSGLPREFREDLSERGDWLFEVVFDYDDGHYQELPADPEGREFAQASIDREPDWPVRLDPFSSYRSGFEVRTYRLCRRVLMFHHFPDELGIDDYLVRSTEFEFQESPIATLMGAVTQSGFVLREDGTYLKKSLPSLEFAYSRAVIRDEVHRIDPESLENLPEGLDGSRYRWTDLDGEGLSGILSEQDGAWFYKRNLSALPVPDGEGETRVTARFAGLERVQPRPSSAPLSEGRLQLADLAGDGQLDVVEWERPTPGFYERTQEGGWNAFKPFSSLPNLSWQDPDLRFVDLTGDGHADILITEEEVLTWYSSLAEKGFTAAERVSRALEEEKGPRVIFNDGMQSIYLADISGDGLTDLVRIRNGEVCYWPNLGYGRFGARVTMDNSPCFDTPDSFDQRRIRLADIDGSGVTDIIYLKDDGVHIYLNESGNRWADAEKLTSFPGVDNLASVQAVDLLGNGTACLVWSSPLPHHTGQVMLYIDPMGGEKPHLLTRMKNNLGAEIQIHYAPSTKFYLADKEAGSPWVTRLPFPVHVVERVETYDHVSRNRFVTRYAYHHGYFDGIEREFRGFGVVEQRDTEEYAALSQSQSLPTGDNIDEASHVPPVLTKTWFHTGVYLAGERVSGFYAGLLDAEDTGEYYREPGLSDSQARDLLLEDTLLPAGLSVQEEREACRALKGTMLRQEVYGLDGGDKQAHPYTVTEQNFTIRCLQGRGDNPHAVFFTHAREAINYYYERQPADPRISHSMTLEVDDFGNVLKEAAVAYGRRETIRIDDGQGGTKEVSNPGLSQLAPEDQEKQTQTFVTYTRNRVTNAVEALDDHQTSLPCETRTFELSGYEPTGQAGRFRFSDFVQSDPANPDRLSGVFDAELSYEERPSTGRQRRLIEHTRTLYRPDDLGSSSEDPLALLELGTLQPLALPGASFKLAFTPGLLSEVYRRPREGESPEDLLPAPDDVLPASDAADPSNRGGYVSSEQLRSQDVFPADPSHPFWTSGDADGHWWIPSGHVFYSPDQTDSGAQELTFAHQHFFLPYRFQDSFGQTTRVFYDTFDLLLLECRDPLDNRVTAGERNSVGQITAQKNDYRVQQPSLITDPNGNRAAIVFDALGMVAGTAAMGKLDENLGDSLEGFEADLAPTVLRDHVENPLADPHAILGRAGTRLLYDPFARPAVVYTLTRQTHDADLEPGQKAAVQHGFAYSDGFGRQVQKKIQAEPGLGPKRDASGAILMGPDDRPLVTETPVSPRWVGSGWTVLNNKDKPVRQYEPFFSDSHQFEFDVRIGVSPVLFYDPSERVVATLGPNHSWEKIVFDPWRQEAWDGNDTLLIDPVTDPDVGDFFSRLEREEYWPSWHALRTDPAHATLAGQRWPDSTTRAAETQAAERASVHAATPTVSHADALGRAFLTVEHNRFKYTTSLPQDPPSEQSLETRFIFDIQGNQREAIDANGRTVMRYVYDMLGDLIRQSSMEAGERWMLSDVTGKSIRSWDSRGHDFTTSYDSLRRPLGLYLTEGTGSVLLERTVYGESSAQPEARNLRGQVVQLCDQSGLLTTDDYDFKGNLLASKRQLAESYQGVLDWQGTVPLESVTYGDRTRYDALNRPVQSVAPHSDQAETRINVLQNVYNEANLLEQVHLWLDLGGEPTGLLDPASASLKVVAGIDYDAKGQRRLIDYGNGVRTSYRINRETSLLEQLVTARSVVEFPGDCQQPPATDWAGCNIQNLYYTYDAVGNITHIRDDAQQTIFFRNRRVEPSADYTYDSLYRLIEATGRQHLGQNGTPQTHSYNDAPRVSLAHPGDGLAMGTYLERYWYDAVGNILEMQHRGNDPSHPGWTRTYTYAETGQLDGSTQSNRLTGTQVGPDQERYSLNGDGYDSHGNMLKMPQLQIMQWDSKDQLMLSRRQAVNTQDIEGALCQGERTYYRYDAAGQRIRKLTELANGSSKHERIYLGGFEIFRQHGGANAGLVRETVRIMDDHNLIALVETRSQGDDPGPAQLVRYQFGNHLGSAHLELDQQAQIISYEEYSPFGSSTYQAVRSQTETPKRYRYTGKERDEENGLYYHGARYYAPWLGRWTAADPVWHFTSNYCYAENNPIVLSDPTGRDVPLYADDSGEWVQGQGLLRSGQIGTGNARLRMHPNGHYYLAEGYTPDVRNPLERAIVNYELTGDESFLDEANNKMKGSGTSDTWRALSWNAAAWHAGKDIRTDSTWWTVVGIAFVVIAAAAGTSRSDSARSVKSKEQQVEAQYRQVEAARKAEAAKRAKAEFYAKARAYQKAVFKTGEPSTVEPRMHVAEQRPYRIPKDMQVAGPGRRVNIGKLDTSKTYLWVVTKSGEVRIAAENQPGLGRPLKHGDLVPGPGGQYRGHARIGGELSFDQSRGVWVMDNDSSFTFARAAGKWTPGPNPDAPWTSGQKGSVTPKWSSAESLEASKELLRLTGTDTSKIVTKDVLAPHR